jgi:hypothetical protein
MSNSKEGYRCQICGKIIPMQDRLSHESICRNKGNQIPIKNINYTKSFEELNNLNNSKNFASIFNFDILYLLLLFMHILLFLKNFSPVNFNSSKAKNMLLLTRKG